MQKLKFRIWDKLTQRFIYPDKGYQGHYVLSLNGEFTNLQNGASGDDFVVQQWTGLTDKNDKEIWEGDICLLDNSEFIMDDGIPQENDLAPITYNEKYGAFYYEPACESLGEIASELEVIGNIFENPDLYEKS